MQRKFMCVLAMALASAMVVAQAQSGAPASPASAGPGASAEGPKLAPGTVLGAELSKGIDAKKAKAGDPVVAKSLMDLRDSSGNVVIPRGTKLVGHITEAKAASKQEPQSTLGIIFDKAELKRGKEIGMHAAIQALERPQPSPATQDQGGGMESPGAPGGGTMGGGQPGMAPGGRNAGGMPGAAPGRQGQTGDMGGGPANAPTGRSNVPALNANSRGAIGMPNVTLSPEASPTQGSMISSSRGNVKLDGGTLLVLRVMGQ